MTHRIPRRSARRAAATLLSLVLCGCSGLPVSVGTATAPPTIDGLPSDSPSVTLDVQIRSVSSQRAAPAGTCPEDATTPPAHVDAQLCSADRTVIYDVGPAAVSGSDIADISSVPHGSGFAVRITLTPQGRAGLSRLTAVAMVASPPVNQLALVSHGRVQVALPVSEQIDGGVLDISGFTSESAAREAADLLLAPA